MANRVRSELEAEHRGESASATLVGSAMEALRVLLPGRVVAVFVQQLFDEPAVARVTPTRSSSSTEYTLELRLASWLGASTEAEVRIVPTFLLPWLDAVRALVVPLVVGGHWRGAIIVEASRLGRQELDLIAQVEQDIAGRLARLELGVQSGGQSERVRFAKSVRRIKTIA